MAETTAEFETPVGVARVTTSQPQGEVRGILALGHGAGGLRWTADILAIRDAALTLGYAVHLVDQPWRVEGKKIGPAPARLDQAWLAVIPRLRRDGLPLVVGGRSAGARVACRCAAAVGARQVVAISFPLHPPGRPERSRAEELVAPAGDGIPVTVIQGASDPFGTPDEVSAALAGRGRVVPVPGPHSLERSAGLVATALDNVLRADELL